MTTNKKIWLSILCIILAYIQFIGWCWYVYLIKGNLICTNTPWIDYVIFQGATDYPPHLETTIDTNGNIVWINPADTDSILDINTIKGFLLINCIIAINIIKLVLIAIVWIVFLALCSIPTMVIIYNIGEQ